MRKEGPIPGMPMSDGGRVAGPPAPGEGQMSTAQSVLVGAGLAADGINAAGRVVEQATNFRKDIAEGTPAAIPDVLKPPQPPRLEQVQPGQGATPFTPEQQRGVQVVLQQESQRAVEGAEAQQLTEAAAQATTAEAPGGVAGIAVGAVEQVLTAQVQNGPDGQQELVNPKGESLNAADLLAAIAGRVAGSAVDHHIDGINRDLQEGKIDQKSAMLQHEIWAELRGEATQATEAFDAKIAELQQIKDNPEFQALGYDAHIHILKLEQSQAEAALKSYEGMLQRVDLDEAQEKRLQKQKKQTESALQMRKDRLEALVEERTNITTTDTEGNEVIVGDQMVKYAQELSDLFPQTEGDKQKLEAQPLVYLQEKLDGVMSDKNKVKAFLEGMQKKKMLPEGDSDVKKALTNLLNVEHTGKGTLKKERIKGAVKTASIFGLLVLFFSMKTGMSEMGMGGQQQGYR